MSNPSCDALKIQVPSLAAVKDHREANTYALMLVALLERGAPMTLAEVAARFDEAGVAPDLCSDRSCSSARLTWIRA